MHWIPWTFVAAFGVVVAVNATMVYFALSTFTGVAVESSYKRGIEYNRVLEAQARQDALGWTLDLAWRAGGTTPTGGEILLRVADAADAPISGLVIESAGLRPLERKAPIPLVFRAVGPGRYAAPAEFDARGNWDIRLDARRGEDRAIVTQRIYVP